MSGAAEVPTQTVAQAVTLLFVPGDRPERFSKASRSGADVVILDLEDSVSRETRGSATTAVLAALSPTALDLGLPAMVRVSSADATDELSSLAALCTLPGHGLLGLIIPKSESAERVRDVRRLFPDGMACIPLIESAAGLLSAFEIARVVGVTRLAFGAVDFGLDVDATHQSVLDHARAHLVIVSAAAGISAPLDSPSLSITDLSTVSNEARRARESGFGGKLCIHPTQVAIVRDGFSPTSEEIDWAREVVEHEGGASQLNGAMIDRPVVERAKKTLSTAARFATIRES